jgi:hypothetical protein
MLPILNTNNIPVSAPGSVATPAAGESTYFFNTADQNKMYYKDDAGNIHIADEVPEGIPDCVCCILKDTTKTWNNALLAGIVTPAEYGTLLTNGFQVSVAGTVYSISNKV